MTVRRRDDSIKPGVGIDKDLGSDFTRVGRVSPWKSNKNDDYLSPHGRREVSGRRCKLFEEQAS